MNTAEWMNMENASFNHSDLPGPLQLQSILLINATFHDYNIIFKGLVGS